MENRDFLYLLTSRLNNSVLEQLSRTQLWNIIREFSSDQHWWYLRVEELLKTNLPERMNADWKKTYKLLEEALDDEDEFNDSTLADPLSVSSLLLAGYDPSLVEYKDAITRIFHWGYTETVKLLLEDGRINPGSEDAVLSLAAMAGHTEIVRLLLADPRVDPSGHNNHAIREASWHGHPEVVKLLLADPRVDPSADKNYAIVKASQNGKLEVVRLLLADPRVDPSAKENESIWQAISGGYIEIVRLLLASPRFIPNIDNTDLVKIAINDGNVELVKLLLSDDRIKFTDNGRMLVQSEQSTSSIEMLYVLATARNIDLQSMNERALYRLLVKLSVDRPAFSKSYQDGLELALQLSGDGLDERDMSSRMSSNNFIHNHYYILLRELLFKQENLKYYFSWLVEQCERHSNALEYRRMIAEAARSYRDTGIVRHDSPYFTAYSGFLLLAKTMNEETAIGRSRSAQAILNLLSSEVGVTQEGLQLAGMLIGAYLGKTRE